MKFNNKKDTKLRRAYIAWEDNDAILKNEEQRHIFDGFTSL